MRVFTDTGRSPAPSRVASMISTARSGSRISAAPAFWRRTARSGQPMLMSTPSKPSSTASSAQRRNCSGTEPKNCAITGRSHSANSRSTISRGAPGEHRPATDVNSVYTACGRLHSVTMRRKAVSVAFAIGASRKNGRGRSSQKERAGGPAGGRPRVVWSRS